MIQSSVPQSIQRSTQLGMANRNVDRLYSVLIRFALDLAWCGVLWRAVACCQYAEFETYVETHPRSTSNLPLSFQPRSVLGGLNNGLYW